MSIDWNKELDALKAEAGKLKADKTPEEINKLLEEFGGYKKADRYKPHLKNGWLKPDGTYIKLDYLDEHELYFARLNDYKKTVHASDMIKKGWVKITQWDNGMKAIGMYVRDLSFEQEHFLKVHNIKAEWCPHHAI